MNRRQRRTYTPEFKQQMVDLYQAGRSRMSLIQDYELTPPALDKWIKQACETVSFKEADNRTKEQNELIQLRKENQQLKMENEILKHAALILEKK